MIEGPDFKNDANAARGSLFEAKELIKEPGFLDKEAILGHLKAVGIYLKHQCEKQEHGITNLPGKALVEIHKTGCSCNGCLRFRVLAQRTKEDKEYKKAKEDEVDEAPPWSNRVTYESPPWRSRVINRDPHVHHYVDEPVQECPNCYGEDCRDGCVNDSHDY